MLPAVLQSSWTTQSHPCHMQQQHAWQSPVTAAHPRIRTQQQDDNEHSVQPRKICKQATSLLLPHNTPLHTQVRRHATTNPLPATPVCHAMLCTAALLSAAPLQTLIHGHMMSTPGQHNNKLADQGHAHPRACPPQDVAVDAAVQMSPGAAANLSYKACDSYTGSSVEHSPPPHPTPLLSPHVLQPLPNSPPPPSYAQIQLVAVDTLSLTPGLVFHEMAALSLMMPLSCALSQK